MRASEKTKDSSGSFGDTIAAISTPPGRGGIGIVRLSGTEARSIGEAVVRLDRPLEPRRAQFAIVPDLEQPHPGETAQILDEVVITYFAGPRSYTGEDVLEIAAHGSPVVLQAILNALLRRGARLAEPGEFTQRAFLAGRLDLTQAEAVHDLINATSLHQARIAAGQLSGSLSSAIAPIKESLICLIALLEAGIDFAEDDLDLASAEQIDRTLVQLIAPIDRLAASFAFGRTLREGFTLAIVGRPNAGKSSLFNALLERDRSIVTASPGTTRDAITERLTFEGIPVELTDTAGLRDAADEAEVLGIGRTRAAMAEAAVILLVVDLAQGLHAEDRAVLAGVIEPTATGDAARVTRQLLLVANKTDTFASPAELASALAAFEIPAELPIVAVSALTGTGLQALRAAIVEVLARDLPDQDSVVITSMRHHAALTAASTRLKQAQSALHQALPHEMLLLDLHEALVALDELTGTTTADDIIGRIFSTFCIGK